MLEYGASYERQRAITGGGELTDVVDALVTEFAEDRFVAPGEVRRMQGHDLLADLDAFLEEH